MMSAAVPCIGILSQLVVAGTDLRQVQPAAEDRLDVTKLPRGRAGLVHVALHAGIALEIEVDVLLGRAALDAELPGKAEGRHAVDEPEVDGLGRPALVRGHLRGRQPEDLGGRRLVNVAILGERRQEALISGEVRHDPQLDL